MPFEALRFIIIEKNDFFALDMKAGLHEACPTAEITRLTRSRDVHLIDDDPLRHTIIITSDRLSVIDDSGLADYALHHDALIIVRAGYDSEAEVMARGFETLSTPFTDDALLIMAQRFMGERAA